MPVATPEFWRPNFLCAVLVGDLLARPQGKAPADIRPFDLDHAIEVKGEAAVEAALHAAFEAMTPATPSDSIASPAAIVVDAGGSSDWDVRFALAEVDRELGRNERAEQALFALGRERPGDARVLAALGALAMDRGRYDEAEQFLLQAAGSTAASARTRYRLALMLLRPSEPAAGRVSEAVSQARMALDAAPASPDYRLALAQALMVAEQWDASASQLRILAALPEWRLRATDEMDELIRRRQQALSAEQQPTLPPAVAQTLPVTPLEIAKVPAPPKPPPPAPMRWPPSGAAIMAGRIDVVDCSGPQKIIVMRHPILDVRFREPKGRPAKLFASPLKEWKEIPCGAKGWTVNVAYRPRRAGDGALGDALAILF
ncbi:MAG: hypothetical protein R2724_12945 [Bryobacterales bacterium]